MKQRFHNPHVANGEAEAYRFNKVWTQTSVPYSLVIPPISLTIGK